MVLRRVPILLIFSVLFSASLSADLETNAERKARQALERYEIRAEEARKHLLPHPVPICWDTYQFTRDNATAGLEFLKFQLGEFYRVTQKDYTRENVRAFEVLDQIVETNCKLSELVEITLKPLNRQKAQGYVKQINFYVSELCWALHCCDYKKVARDLRRLSDVSKAYRYFYCKAMCLEEPYWKDCFGVCEQSPAL